MRLVKITAVTALLLLLVAGNIQAAGQKLNIHLPRDVTIKDNSVMLGQVCIVSGDETLTAKARQIPLGRITLAGQHLTVDRNTILSRLAANGISNSNVKITGAKDVKVKRKEQTITNDMLAKKAESFLKSISSAQATTTLEIARIPKEVTIPGTPKSITLVARPGSVNSPTYRSALVDVVADGKVIQTREVSFRLKHTVRQIVATVDMPAGIPLTPDNITIETITSNRPEPKGWNAPYGLVTKRKIKAGQTVIDGMVSLPKPQVLIKRNQTVVIKVQTAGLLITAMGQSLSEGSLGQYVRVRNVDSGRIIIGKVNEDGTVAPVL